MKLQYLVLPDSKEAIKEKKVLSKYPQSAKDRIICASIGIITEMDRKTSNMFKPMYLK